MRKGLINCAVLLGLAGGFLPGQADAAPILTVGALTLEVTQCDGAACGKFEVVAFGTSGFRFQGIGGTAFSSGGVDTTIDFTVTSSGAAIRAVELQLAGTGFYTNTTANVFGLNTVGLGQVTADAGETSRLSVSPARTFLSFTADTFSGDDFQVVNGAPEFTGGQTDTVTYVFDVPEPASAALLMVGLLAAARRRRS